MTKTFAEECRATREVLNRVGDKWSVLVIVNLGEGAQRFSALKRNIDGISQRMLTLTVRSLERDGLISRTVTATAIPARVDYALTRLGRTLLDPVRALALWAQRHSPDVQRSRDAYDRTAKRAPREA
ncbi:MAG TPA: helix-turn-helix domain-containing protein [Polyangia bacterium]|jgi:DNA-binding HxlR family transcriptional regulator|nr:helix-turn-helix domain-containing protein [Polyangia bacterium]